MLPRPRHPRATSRRDSAQLGRNAGRENVNKIANLFPKPTHLPLALHLPFLHRQESVHTSIQRYKISGTQREILFWSGNAQRMCASWTCIQ